MCSKLIEEKFSAVTTIFNIVFLASCALNKQPAISEILENNVVWSSSDGLVNVYVEGGSKTNSIGVISYIDSGIKKSNLSTFSDATQSLNVIGQLNQLYFDFEIHRNNDTIIAKGGPSFFGENYVTTLTKRKLSKGELDAKYFVWTTWFNDTLSLEINYGTYSVSTANPKGTFENESIELQFLENNGFSLSKEDLPYCQGRYESKEDGSLVLFPESGIGLEKLGSEVFLSSKEYNNKDEIQYILGLEI